MVRLTTVKRILALALFSVVYFWRSCVFLWVCFLLKLSCVSWLIIYFGCHVFFSVADPVRILPISTEQAGSGSCLIKYTNQFHRYFYFVMTRSFLYPKSINLFRYLRSINFYYLKFLLTKNKLLPRNWQKWTNVVMNRRIRSRIFDETLFMIFVKHETRENAPVFRETLARFARSNFRDFRVSRKL